MGWVTELPEGHSYDESLLALHPIAPITELLQALADPVRLEVIRDLAESKEPRPCGSLIKSVTKSTLSHHLRILREAGVIQMRVDGTRKLTSLRRTELNEAYPGLLESILRAPLPEAVAT
jgi:DNA-binding transcriptional ArsR family regulator